MEPQKTSFWRRAWRAIRIPLVVIVVLYIGLVIYRIPAAFDRQKTEEVVAKIQAEKLKLGDVMGENLPPAPDPAIQDASVAGVDANGNGIRDDVELAIFKLYPNSARIRAAELQYAMALQNELTQVFNSETWIAAVQKESPALSCVEDLKLDGGEVKDLVLNTDLRKKQREDIFKNYSASFTLISGNHCDIEPTPLPN